MNQMINAGRKQRLELILEEYLVMFERAKTKEEFNCYCPVFIRAITEYRLMATEAADKILERYQEIDYRKPWRRSPFL